ncbi:MAG: right-handed parallel beta-helix repeat-containing protein [Candidatus Zixiibacteriota bacterium]
MNAQSVDDSSAVSVTFDSDMNVASISDAVFLVSSGFLGKLDGTITYDSASRTASFIPSSEFVPGDLISVTLTKGIESAVAIPLFDGYVWRFTVEADSGHGVFSVDSAYDCGDQPRGLVAADFDGDLDIDLAVANLTLDRVTILLGNGDGTFTNGPYYSVGDGPASLTAVDFDNDLDVDIVTANVIEGSISVLTNDGSGSFVLTLTEMLSSGAGPYYIVNADYNCDGYSDLAAADMDRMKYVILYNSGAGFISSQTEGSVGGSPWAIHAADLDFDGKMDLVTANPEANNISIVFQQANNTFAGSDNLTVGGSPMGITSADITGDGFLDLVMSSADSDYVSYLAMTYPPGTPFGERIILGATGDYPIAVTIGDIMADGSLDLITANFSADNISTFVHNIGDSTFSGPINYTVGDGPSRLCVADFDNDGDLDIAVANRGTDNISILKNGMGTPTTYIVTRLADDENEGSLRWAFNQANSATPYQMDTVKWDQALSGTIYLTDTLPTLNDPMGIVLLGDSLEPRRVIISGTNLPQLKTSTAYDAYVIKIDQNRNFQVWDYEVWDSYEYGFLILNSNHGYIKSCYMQNCTYGIRLFKCTDVDVGAGYYLTEENDVAGNHIVECAYGISYELSKEIRILGNTLDNCVTGIEQINSWGCSIGSVLNSPNPSSYEYANDINYDVWHHVNIRAIYVSGVLPYFNQTQQSQLWIATIHNNTISAAYSISTMGILVEGCDVFNPFSANNFNLLIADNEISGFVNGIYLDGSERVLVGGNKLISNEKSIAVYGDQNDISSNEIPPYENAYDSPYSGSQWGIMINGNDNSVARNHIYYNTIAIEMSISSSLNHIYENYLGWVYAGGGPFPNERGIIDRTGNEINTNEIYSGVVGIDEYLGANQSSSHIWANHIAESDYGIRIHGMGAVGLVNELPVAAETHAKMNMEKTENDAPTEGANWDIHGNDIYYTNLHGIYLENVAGMYIHNNDIHGNQGNGITIVGEPTARGNRVSQNSIRNNYGLAFDLGDDGVTDNDQSDADTGPNDLLNFPVLQAQVATSNPLLFDLTGSACDGCTVELFKAISGDYPYFTYAADPSGHGEAPEYVASATASGGQFTFADLPAGLYTTTAIDAEGNTSEFSENFWIRGPFYVSNYASSGENTLRDKILEANSYPYSAIIKFQGTPQRIMLDEELPPLTNPDGIFIDGCSAPGGPGSLIIDGSQLSGTPFHDYLSGLTIESDMNEVCGLTIVDCEVGLTVYGGSENRIYNNYLGVESDGVTVNGNGMGIRVLDQSANNYIGSDGANVISGNLMDGILCAGNSGDVNGTTVHGNKIGTSADGTIPLPNGGFGIKVSDNGKVFISNNLVSASQDYGIYASNSYAIITDNVIGAADGVNLNMGNDDGGIMISGSDHIRIDGNTIATNRGNGIDIYDCPVVLGGIGALSEPNSIKNNDGVGVAIRQSSEVHLTNNTISGNDTGIYISENSHDCQVSKCTIKDNGVSVVLRGSGTIHNRLTQNVIYGCTYGPDIDLYPPGITNFNQWTTESPNEMLNRPVLDWVGATNGGTVNVSAPPTSIVELYAVIDTAKPYTNASFCINGECFGGAAIFLDSVGPCDDFWQCGTLTFIGDFGDWMLTGLAHYENGSTSEFAQNCWVHPRLFRAFCPVTVEITDPNGRSIGEGLNEIPGASYDGITDYDGDGEPDVAISLSSQILGDYLIKVLPKPDAEPTDTYSIFFVNENSDTTYIVRDSVVPPQGGYHEFEYTPSPDYTCCNLAGDANDNSVVNILDVTYILAYRFKSGPPPPCLQEADANGNGIINILDATYIIAYRFKGGPAPVCGP